MLLWCAVCLLCFVANDGCTHKDQVCKTFVNSKIEHDFYICCYLNRNILIIDYRLIK
jgi:hypothetical protein